MRRFCVPGGVPGDVPHVGGPQRADRASDAARVPPSRAHAHARTALHTGAAGAGRGRPHVSTSATLAGNWRRLAHGWAYGGWCDVTVLCDVLHYCINKRVPVGVLATYLAYFLRLLTQDLHSILGRMMARVVAETGTLRV